MRIFPKRIIRSMRTEQLWHTYINIRLRVITLHSRQREIPWRFAALLPMLSVTHIMPALLLLSVMGVRMQQCMMRNQNEMHKLSKIKNEHKYVANNKQF